MVHVRDDCYVAQFIAGGDLSLNIEHAGVSFALLMGSAARCGGASSVFAPQVRSPWRGTSASAKADRARRRTGLDPAAARPS
jgi:hypothetical protein